MHELDKPSVVVRNVSRIYRADNKSSIFNRPLASMTNEKKYVRAINDVSMYASTGECIGVIGRNGSGKSTLMRLIAGNEAPDRGDIWVNATPTLLNVSAALQPRLSGYKNIRLGLLAQGAADEDIPRLTEEIVDFADIGKAVDRPMKTYSSGMGARLKFAISTALQRDLLLIDEALGTGDASFTEKAQRRMSAFLQDAGTIFLVSHAMSSIRSMCTRAIWLHDGEIIADGDVDSIALLYNKWTARTARGNTEAADDLIEHVKSVYRRPKIEIGDGAKSP
ncbi:ATP-binding cassette domain-containing protein [Corynebacterium sp. zg254]|uniref:ABC transporter ATP-binding protein n=1 Tax=Corynebacterium zhongnanshanii TaxID=2768834 RepID=A0ABQ6VCL5_9CORY|nr:MULTISPECIES: ABC transporter ATP-binding protein [Corynebacterium]KAB3519956.1 ABC transporter ATP-binding protein [Corynebacterium zhongnanshanii]MCR5914905.1 ATP-binding cassette domain-containing protein [Corynebacterium sp. zg254]